MTIKTLLSKIKEKRPQADLKLIEKAYNFAHLAHQGQRRLSGETYINHPLEVAYFLAERGLDELTIMAALLHDVPEDTRYSLEKIKEEFGTKIAELVFGVTKLKGFRYYTQKGELENLRKMFLAMAVDMRVVLIRLSDQLHNLKTLSCLDKEKQKRIAHQALEIYAPLADRLGMGELRGELEDLAFSYVLPSEFRWAKKLVKEGKKEREAYIKKVIGALKTLLEKNGLKIRRIDGRAKHLYSLYTKLLINDKDISRIYDLEAVRVILDTVADCYKALGLIHSKFKPLLGRIKDYIAMPKPNGYRSLHTTIFCLGGRIIEVQIKTLEMHKEAEWGIAAHFHYTEVGKESLAVPSEKIRWVRQLSSFKKDLLSLDEFSEILKNELLGGRIYLFTPAGEVKELPEGATPVDFAYEIHSDLGNRCLGAKVNGKIVPLDSSLRNGDVVEILTSKRPSGPSHDWLSFVKTKEAKSKIRAWFKKFDQEENLKLGRDLLEKEIKRIFKKSLEEIEKEKITSTLDELGYKNFDELTLAVGEGRILPSQVLKKIFKGEEIFPQRKVEEYLRIGKPKVIVEGERNLLLRLSSCCQPQIGEEITGYITSGCGVTIHRKTCKNIRSLNKKRFVQAWWEDRSWKVPVRILVYDRIGLLGEIGNIASALKINLIDLRYNLGENKKAELDVSLEVSNLDQVTSFFRKVEKVEGVIGVERRT